MSTKRLCFFMRPSEFDEIVDHWRSQQGLHVLVPKDGALIVCDDSHLYYTEREFFISETIPEILRWDSSEAPGQLGWIEVTPPIEEGKVLFHAEIASKSDWYDTETKTQRQNPTVHDLLKRVVKVARRNLKFVVWAKNVAFETPWQSYRDIGYSPGVVDWAKSGGELRQWGVKNVIFSISPD